MQVTSTQEVAVDEVSTGGQATSVGMASTDRVIGNSGRLPRSRTGTFSPVMWCRFLDASVWDPDWIGAKHGHCLAGELAPKPDEFVLHTGQRVELYSQSRNASEDGDRRMPDAAGRIDGERAVRRRLTEIAAGLRSEVRGDNLVLHQVEQVGQRLSDGHPFRRIVAESVALARTLRGAHNFAAAVDYPAAALHLMTENAPAAGRTLLVIGGGTLGRALAERGVATGYDRTLIVTRSPRRARDSLRGPGAKAISVYTPLRAREALGSGSWDAAIATSGVDDLYRARILTWLDTPGCMSAVDLSSVPLRKATSSRCEHRAGPRLTTLIAQQNQLVAEAARRMHRAIAEHFQEA